MRRLLPWSNLLWLYSFLSCQSPAPSHDQPLVLNVPSHFPAIVFPDDNGPTELRVELGRRLFYHRGLSSDQSMSCSSCHVQSSAFTDGRSVSPGIDEALGKRNTPTLANLAWSPYLMSEGGVPSLELQALAPLHEPLEMGQNMIPTLDVLNRDDHLRKLSRSAYGRDSIDPYVVTRALACFQRTMISGDSKYDQFLVGKAVLSATEKRGMDLFFEVGCAVCHREPFFTDFGFYNIGLYPNANDPGLERKTHLKADSGKFKTPTLRNIALTGPYMHDGSMNTLEEVVAFYNRGGTPSRLRDKRIQALHLLLEDEQALVAFLETLTDWNFVQNSRLTQLVE